MKTVDHAHYAFVIDLSLPGFSPIYRYNRDRAMELVGLFLEEFESNGSTYECVEIGEQGSLYAVYDESGDQVDLSVTRISIL